MVFNNTGSDSELPIRVRHPSPARPGVSDVINRLEVAAYSATSSADRMTGAFHLAATRGVLKEMNRLFTNGARIDCEFEGVTALHRAAWRGHRKVAIFLLERDANIEAKATPTNPEALGARPLHYASSGGCEDVVRVLLDHKADMAARDARGAQPLHRAAQRGQEGIVRLLVKRGADIEARNVNGWTPIMVAAGQGHLPVLRALLNREGRPNLPKADIHVVSDIGETPLHAAAWYNSRNTAEYLLDRKLVSVNNTTDDKLTPLHMAAIQGHADMAELLLSRGAKLSARTHRGETPLDIALLRRRTAVEALLRSAKATQDEKRRQEEMKRQEGKRIQEEEKQESTQDQEGNSNKTSQKALEDDRDGSVPT